MNFKGVKKMTESKVKKIMKTVENQKKQRDVFEKAEQKRDKEFVEIEDILDEYDEDYANMSAYDRSMISRKELESEPSDYLEEECIRSDLERK